IQHRGRLTFEITPETAPDAYGGWWVSIYDEALLDQSRATEKELKAITVLRPKFGVAGAYASGAKAADEGSNEITTHNLQDPGTTAGTSDSAGGYHARDFQYARKSKRSGGGSVYVNGYYRKDGTYVHSYTRSAPRR